MMNDGKNPKRRVAMTKVEGAIKTGSRRGGAGRAQEVGTNLDNVSNSIRSAGR
jgi:hypothetical protein